MLPPPDEAATRDRFQVATWAISGFLAMIGLLFGVYSGVPWASKGDLVQVTREVERDRQERIKLDEQSQVDRTRNTLAIQGLQYEVRQTRDELKWTMTELEKLRAYVYPQRTGRILPPPESRLSTWPGP